MIIRPYEPRDRATVRHICCETADAGQPVEALCSDRELIADLVTRYYTDYEPGFSWVAEQAGAVTGYLTGCLDTAHQQHQVRSRIAPAALLPRLGRREVWRLMRGAWRSRPTTTEYLREYPASLHLNLLPAARGQAVGRALVDRLVEQIRGCVPGLHASTRADNAGAAAFFARLGFTAVARWPMVLPRAAGGWLTTETVIYAKRM